MCRLTCEVTRLYLLFQFAMGAVLLDIKYDRIPNAYILIGLLNGLYRCWLLEGNSGIMVSLLNMILILCALFPLYALQALGAGDCKLFCVIACFFNLEVLFQSLLLSLLLSCPAGIYLLIKKKFRKNLSLIQAYTHIHFTIPIFLSVLLHIGGFY